MAEDLTTYTEVDPGADLTVTSTTVTYTNLPRNLDTFLYDDFGVNFFDKNIGVKCSGEMSGSTQIAGIISSPVFANVVDDGLGIRDGGGDALLMRQSRVSSAWSIEAIEFDGGVQHADQHLTSLNFTKWFTITRDDDDGAFGAWDIDIFSDSGRTTLVDSLSISLHTSKKDYRYSYAMQSWNSGSAAAATGFMENFVITTPTAGNGNLLMMGAA